MLLGERSVLFDLGKKAVTPGRREQAFFQTCVHVFPVFSANLQRETSDQITSFVKRQLGQISISFSGGVKGNLLSPVLLTLRTLIQKFSIAITANGRRVAEIRVLPKTKESCLIVAYLLPVI